LALYFYTSESSCNLNDLQLKLQNGIYWKQLSMKADCFSGFLGVMCALAGYKQGIELTPGPLTPAEVSEAV
jgi:hypothetical protein